MSANKFASKAIDRAPVEKLIQMIGGGSVHLGNTWVDGKPLLDILLIFYNGKDAFDVVDAHIRQTGGLGNIPGSAILEIARRDKGVLPLLLDKYEQDEDIVAKLALQQMRNDDSLVKMLIRAKDLKTLHRIQPFFPPLFEKHGGEYPIQTAIKTCDTSIVKEVLRRGATLDVPNIIDTVVASGSVDVARYVFDQLEPTADSLAIFKNKMEPDPKNEMWVYLTEQLSGDNWRLHDKKPHIVSSYSEDVSLGYGTLEIFNFAAGDGERITIMRNFETKQESMSRQEFNDISDRQAISLAAEKLVELGGVLPDRTAHLLGEGDKPAIRLVRKVQKP